MSRSRRWRFSVFFACQSLSQNGMEMAKMSQKRKEVNESRKNKNSKTEKKKKIQKNSIIWPLMAPCRTHIPAPEWDASITGQNKDGSALWINAPERLSLDAGMSTRSRRTTVFPFAETIVWLWPTSKRRCATCAIWAPAGKFAADHPLRDTNACAGWSCMRTVTSTRADFAESAKAWITTGEPARTISFIFGDKLATGCPLMTCRLCLSCIFRVAELFC